MSDPTAAPVEGTSTSTPAEATPTATPDPMAPLMSRMEELASNVGNISTRFDTFEQRLPQPETPVEPDPWAALIPETEPDQYFDQYGNPVQIPQQQPGLDISQLQQAVQGQIQQAITPYQQQMQQMQVERADQQLGQMIPALANTPENQQNRQQAFSLVSQALQNYPTAVANQLMADPNFIATQWKAAEADRIAAGQVPASATAPTLESAGGATPGGTTESPIDQMFAGQSSKALARGFY